MPATFFHPSKLLFVEGRLASDSAACYRPHSHPTFSIGCVDAGSSTLSLEGRKLRLRAGDVVLINAGMVHSCNPRPGRSWSYRMLYFDRLGSDCPPPTSNGELRFAAPAPGSRSTR